MTNAFIDTDVIIRLLTGDDLDKQTQAAALFTQIRAGSVQAAAPDTVIADAVYVLSSPRLYRVPHVQIEALLRPLVSLPKFRVRNKQVVLLALSYYARHNADFGDAMLAASIERTNPTPILFSYDTDFDHIPGIQRVEPSL